MRRVVAAVFTLVCAIPASGTGVEADGCRRYQLTSTELFQMDARVKAVAGRGLDKSEVHACRTRGAEVYASGQTSRLHEADGLEQWYEASCVLDFAELQGELWMPTLRVEIDEINHSFAISTYDFRIRFLVAPEPDGALQLECWDRSTPTRFGVFLGR